MTDRGATVVEYALLVALVSVASIAALTALGGSGSDTFDAASGEIASPADGSDPDTPSPPDPTPPPGGGGGAGGGGGGGGAGGGGGVTTTTAPPATTTPPTTTPAPAPESTSEWSSSGASMHNPNKWRSDATVSIVGTDGQPLTTVSAGVQIRVVQTYRTWDGTLDEQSWTTEAPLSDGQANVSDFPLDAPKNDKWHVVAMRYEVVDVVYYWPRDPAVRWDGATPSVTILAP